MGAHRKTHCLNGHLLAEPNLAYNSCGYRECKTCRLARMRAYLKRIREEKRSAKASSNNSATL